MSDIPDDIQITAQQLVDATFHAEIDRWDGNPDLPHILVSYVARAIMAERERCAKIAEAHVTAFNESPSNEIDHGLNWSGYSAKSIAAAIRAGEKQ